MRLLRRDRRGTASPLSLRSPFGAGHSHMKETLLVSVMAGPAEGRVTAIHALDAAKPDVDGRDKHGHDEKRGCPKSNAIAVPP